ncbi:MAG: dockerin type I domain-containing protein, partial [Candidatus Berkelbacteria bacterium]|nr:dockerin type I domain-containing protein [Candidatus Berkelbacteria bacterium]
GGGGGGGGMIIAQTPTLSAAAQKVDANKDGKVDVLDFNSLMVNWGSTTVGNVADFNSDGKVDIIDFNMLMVNWTK